MAGHAPGAPRVLRARGDRVVPASQRAWWRRPRQLRLVPTRANTQPAFGCYLPSPQAPIARPYGLLVLTLAGDHIAAITWFWDTSIFPYFGLPRSLPA